MKNDIADIGTWPTPERPVSFKIPVKLLREFESEARIVIRHPWVVGIPVPEVLLKKLGQTPEVYRELIKTFEVMLIPR